MANLPIAPTVAPQSKLPFVDKDGVLTQVGKQFLQQLYNQTVGCARIIPCLCTNVGNVYTLTMQGVQPVYTGYADGDVFSFVASATSTGTVTALVVTRVATLATQSVIKPSGVAATAGDIQINVQYMLTALDSKFVLR